MSFFTNHDFDKISDLLTPNVSNPSVSESIKGPIKLKVYGKGGIVAEPGDDGLTKVCPDQSQNVCTEVTIPQSIVDPGGSDDDLKEREGLMEINGEVYRVRIVEHGKLEVLGKNSLIDRSNSVKVVLNK